jgi:F-type H+-transporting ATPase subunit b
MPALFHEPEFWVLIAAIVFVAGIWKPAKRSLIGSLDARAERIRAELDEAGDLRMAAQATLADYRQKQRAAADEAQQIVSHAQAEAARLAAQMAGDLDAALARRRQLMRERIAQAEQRALAEIRATAIDVAIAAARRVIAEGLDEQRRAGLIDAAIAQLPQQLR